MPASKGPIWPDSSLTSVTDNVRYAGRSGPRPQPRRQSDHGRSHSPCPPPTRSSRGRQSQRQLRALPAGRWFAQACAARSPWQAVPRSAAVPDSSPSPLPNRSWMWWPAFEPCYMTLPLPTDGDGRIVAAARDAVAAQPADSVACGPGLGQDPSVRPLVKWMYQSLRQPLVDRRRRLERLGPPARRSA